MFLLEWYREYLQLKYDFRERKNKVVVEEKICQSCETLRQQLEQVNYEKTQLLAKILREPPSIEEAKEGPKITVPRAIPWAVRRQLLEQEDRKKAQLLREAPKPISTEDLEKELEIASTEREKEAVK